MAPSKARSINILGVTGSIGQSAFDVILAHSEQFDVQMVSAANNAQSLAEMAVRLKAKQAVLAYDTNFDALKSALEGHDIEALCGQENLIKAASSPVDITLAAIVGMAGLKPIWAAIEGSAYLAIANKEPLVAAGPMIMKHAEKHDCTLLPVDSEHNAIFQVFDAGQKEAIEKIILTASGGPFLDWDEEAVLKATPEQAINHPNWTMGAKISVDSATMMNKALEIIEAHILFDLPADQIDVVIHPQSIVHSMVEYADGSVLAQMGASDMRTALSHTLYYPQRLSTPGERLDLKTLNSLTFVDIESKKFPFIALAYDAIARGLYACVAMNAANEIAVDSFLSKDITFGDIFDVVGAIVSEAKEKELSCLEDILSYDHEAREKTAGVIQQKTKDKVA